MKTIDKMSRLTGELEKIFRMLNEDMFDNIKTPLFDLDNDVPHQKRHNKANLCYIKQVKA